MAGRGNGFGDLLAGLADALRALVGAQPAPAPVPVPVRVNRPKQG